MDLKKMTKDSKIISKNINSNTDLVDSFLEKSKEEWAKEYYDLFNERLEEKAYHVYNFIEDEINEKLSILKGVEPNDN